MSFKPLRSGALDRTVGVRGCNPRRQVSNPFVAGHWIVRDERGEGWREVPGFKPLRSGALDRTGPTTPILSARI